MQNNRGNTQAVATVFFLHMQLRVIRNWRSLRGFRLWNCGAIVAAVLAGCGLIRRG
jgi:hypothetical protein